MCIKIGVLFTIIGVLCVWCSDTATALINCGCRFKCSMEGYENKTE